MRLLPVVFLVAMQSVSASEVDWVNALLDFNAAFRAATAACATGSTRCDEKRIEELKKDLEAAVVRAKDEKKLLSDRAGTEYDSSVRALLERRVNSLDAAITASRDLLGSGITPDAEFEAQLAKKIDDLVAEVINQNALCERKDEYCDLAKLSENRFKLRDLMQRATAIDEKVLAEYKKAKPGDEENLHARHVVLLKAIHGAREISFVVHADRTKADDLVDRFEIARRRTHETRGRRR